MKRSRASIRLAAPGGCARAVALQARAASCVVGCAIVLAGSMTAMAEDTVAKTDDVLSSVSSIARNLKLADVPSPIDVTADRLDFDYNKGLMRYTGNVRVEHAGATIRAQEIEVSFQTEGKRELRKITAHGGVEVVRGDETAHGEVAEYDPKAATIVLSQKARLGSGPNSLSGERVIVYLQERRAVVQGGAEGSTTAARPDGEHAQGGAANAAPPGRVRVVIMPDSVKPGAALSESAKPGTQAAKSGAKGNEGDKRK